MKNITLEMSIKPFFRKDAPPFEEVARRVFLDWMPLYRKGAEATVMLWTADGSELLDYRGRMEDAFEWCYHIGGANNYEHASRHLDPKGTGLHSRSYPYTEAPPRVTYGDLKRIVAALKKVGGEILGVPVSVGTTFDVGPEFAISDFKYRRHREICMGNDMGEKTMVCAYATLHGDSVSYAGFPEGIPEGLPFGTFLGRQSLHFLRDMGFDYIWFSNGLGFGMEPWSPHGALFNGEGFREEKIAEVREKSMEFWRLFRLECPDYPIRTRGTNMTMGIDMASDGVPLWDIYSTVPNLLPPPNSPWAALNFDFGLEMAGYLSRMAELPNEDYLFRFYVHDPWWANSPWQDRYGGEAHDVYLPLAACRIDAEGRAKNPSHLSLLSIDNSFGEMPQNCAVEPIAHLLRAEREAPDAPSPFVWLYPFREYSRAESAAELRRMSSGDWHVRCAINAGLPLSSVLSTHAFAQRKCWDALRASVLYTPVPPAGEVADALLSYMDQGGRVLFYGSCLGGDPRILSRLGIALGEEIAGETTVSLAGEEKPLLVDGLMSDGGLAEIFAGGDTECIATACGRAVAVAGERIGWSRGLCAVVWHGRRNLPHGVDHFRGETLPLFILRKMGVVLDYLKKDPRSLPPVTMLHRHNGGLYLSAFAADTTVETALRFPLGAPIFLGCEAEMREGVAHYRFSKATRRECRVLVEQKSGVIGCREVAPVSYFMRRRINVRGLENATLRFFPESDCLHDVEAVLNSCHDAWAVSDPFDASWEEKDGCRYYEVRNVTGQITLSLPFHPKSE